MPVGFVARLRHNPSQTPDFLGIFSSRVCARCLGLHVELESMPRGAYAFVHRGEVAANRAPDRASSPQPRCVTKLTGRRSPSHDEWRVALGWLLTASDSPAS